MVSEAQKKENRKIADAIKKWMLVNMVADDTRIYFNGKCYNSVGYGKDAKYRTLYDIKGSDFTEYANDDAVTMTFEGIFYEVINGEYGSIMLKSFNKLIRNFGYYYELGNAWNLSLYKNDKWKKGVEEKKKKKFRGKYADYWKVGDKY